MELLDEGLFHKTEPNTPEAETLPEFGPQPKPESPRPVPPPSLSERISSPEVDHRDYRDVTVQEMQDMGIKDWIADQMSQFLAVEDEPVSKEKFEELKLDVIGWTIDRLKQVEEENPEMFGSD